MLVSRNGNVFRGFADLRTWIGEHLRIESAVLERSQLERPPLGQALDLVLPAELQVQIEGRRSHESGACLAVVLIQSAPSRSRFCTIGVPVPKNRRHETSLCRCIRSDSRNSCSTFNRCLLYIWSTARLRQCLTASAQLRSAYRTGPRAALSIRCLCSEGRIS